MKKISDYFRVQPSSAELAGASDQQLIAQMLKNDQAATAALVKRYLNLVYHICRHYVPDRDEAEDVVQDTFVKVWKNLKKYQPEKSFKAWLAEIAKNTALDWLKKKKPAPFSALDNQTEKMNFIDLIPDHALSASELIDNNLVTAKIKSAIASLPNLYQDIIVLRHDNNLSFREIAVAGGESVNTVKSRHRRAVSRLRKLLADY